MVAPIPSRSAQVDLWVVPVAEPIGGSPFPPETLSDEELARASRFRQRSDYLQFIHARHALRTLIGRRLGSRAQDVKFRIGAQGKPALADATNAIEFNVSHTRGLALIALADGVAVGVDVEWFPEAEERLDGVRAVLSDEEERLLRSDATIPARHLLVTWALKEAILKADGRGMSASPQDITVLTGIRDLLASGRGTCGAFSRVWQLRVLEPLPGYVGAVAVDAEALELRIHEWD